ncbi:LysR family transcriptional regulator [Dictyobacter alpinus]|uniref:LysR family transcriptional regulator n=1 Tax=Dictyobacter alpinus TaxID=2014873 RepID=A0A402BKI7_9CHLR|nr:LysR family transcriptional regulator [Dictyobacter alpinus]GCE31851.1 LysR family transcriptional regulator [Dictyobacter alpinus]
MNFSQLQCFVALAKTSSFTEAAYEVDLTQSAVSHALAALESELGVTLLERNRKGVVSLTHVGQKILPHAQALLVQSETIEQEARSAQGLVKGKLRLGHVLSLCPGLIARLLTIFQQQYPDIEVVLFEGSMQEVYEWIEGGIVDVGFILHPARAIKSTLIATDELCVILPSNHHFQTETGVPHNRLYEYDFIMAKAGCSFQMLEMAGLKLGKIKPRIRYQASDSATILAMIREGLGIGILPRMMVPKKLEGVVALPLDPPQQLQIGLATKSSEMSSPAAKLFIQTASTVHSD